MLTKKWFDVVIGRTHLVYVSFLYTIECVVHCRGYVGRGHNVLLYHRVVSQTQIEYSFPNEMTGSIGTLVHRE